MTVVEAFVSLPQNERQAIVNVIVIITCFCMVHIADVAKTVIRELLRRNNHNG